MLICVGIPTIDGKVCAATIDSLLAEQVRALGQGDHLLVLWLVGNSAINLARNKIAKQFIDIKQAECLVFVDADISWKCGDLLRLAHSDKDVIGGAYRIKTDQETYKIASPCERDGDLYRVGGLPGGFLKISRRAFESIDARPYQDDIGKVWFDWFPTGFLGGVMCTEDYGFCWQWRKTGGTVWLDPSIKLKHHDGGRHFTGDPAAWLLGCSNEQERLVCLIDAALAAA